MHDVEASHYRICPLCEACCGLEIRTALEPGGARRVTSIRGAEEDVFSAGYLCPKAYALRDLHEDPDRLRAPLVKRDGHFVEVDWDEAFGEIDRRLTRILGVYGRDAAAVMIGNPAAHKMGLLLYTSKLVRALGTRNVYSASTLDQMPKQLASGLMFGHWLSVAVPDIERCGYLLILGANPMASNGSMWTVPDFRAKARALRSRGGRIVVVDPRRTETADIADEHHFIRPGADVFLLAAMVHTLFDEGLVRLGRLAEHVDGVSDVRDAVSGFVPERVANRSGIEAGEIRRLTRELAAAETACVYGRIGTCTQEYGSLASWLVDVLNALTGNLDAPGGAMFPRAAAFARNTTGAPGVGRGISVGRHRSRVSGAPEVLGELPAACLAEEIETPGAGQVKALITIASNPVLSAPNGARLTHALAQLELMVSLDIYLNETTRMADVILPPPSPLEDSHYDVSFTQLSFRNHARYSAAVLDPPPGQQPEWQNMVRLIAIAKGLGAKVDVLAVDDELVAEDLRKLAGPSTDAILAMVSRYSGPERQVELALRNGPYGDHFGMNPGGLTLEKVMNAAGGIDLGPLAPRIPEMLRTPSGKVELAPALLLSDLRRATTDMERPAPDLVLIGRRHVRSNNSWMHNLPSLAKGPARCTALVHPADASRLGIRDGGEAEIRSGERAIRVRTEVSDEMMLGVVSLPHGWGHDLPGVKLGVAAVRPGANLNALLDEDLREPLTGNAVLGGVAVEMRPLDSEATGRASGVQ